MPAHMLGSFTYSDNIEYTLEGGADGDLLFALLQMLMANRHRFRQARDLSLAFDSDSGGGQ